MGLRDMGNTETEMEAVTLRAFFACNLKDGFKNNKSYRLVG